MPEEPETTENQPSGEDFKELRARAKRAEEAERQRDALLRELAFARADLPKDMPGRDYFAKAYEGDLTADAIRKAATEAGLIKVEPQVPAEERAALEAINAASAGATQPPPFDFAAEVAKATTPEQVMALAQRAGMPTTWDNQ